jgi:methylmalonyl-CoA/ethylmalonyl-CoA epimerase
MKLHHVGIAVHDIEQALVPFQLLGLRESEHGIAEAFNVAISMVRVGEARLEFLQPLGEGPIKKFLEKHGEGLHHIAFAVSDIERTLADLKRQGTKLIDETPRSGFGGHRVAFVHPRNFNGVLVELIEDRNPKHKESD